MRRAARPHVNKLKCLGFGQAGRGGLQCCAFRTRCAAAPLLQTRRPGRAHLGGSREAAAEIRLHTGPANRINPAAPSEEGGGGGSVGRGHPSRVSTSRAGGASAASGNRGQVKIRGLQVNSSQPTTVTRPLCVRGGRNPRSPASKREEFISTLTFIIIQSGTRTRWWRGGVFGGRVREPHSPCRTTSGSGVGGTREKFNTYLAPWGIGSLRRTPYILLRM